MEPSLGKPSFGYALRMRGLDSFMCPHNDTPPVFPLSPLQSHQETGKAAESMLESSAYTDSGIVDQAAVRLVAHCAGKLPRAALVVSRK